MHYSLPKNSPGAGKYRHTIDYMGHKDTGGKALIYIIDGIWGGESWEGWIKKFKSDPFNNDYPNSIFVGQDPVALESVCFDILFQEYVEDNTKNNYPIQMKVEIADYLAQAASSDYWPDGIQYDPEGDGTPIESLGVFEHWNNPVDRQYSRNLGTGEGIELNYFNVTSTDVPSHFTENISIASPNPFSSFTEFRKPANISENSELKIYTLKGEMIARYRFGQSEVIVWNGQGENGSRLSDGLYIYRIIDKDNHLVLNGKVILRK